MSVAHRLAPLVLGAVALVSCATNPVTGRQQFLLVDNAALASSADAAWNDLRAKTPISTNQAKINRVRTVGQRLIAAAGLPGNFEFVLFATNEKNAFVLPGGQIGVYEGILEVATTDAELAAIIGHELAHQTLNHAAERYSQATAAQVGYALAGTQVQGAALQAVGLGLQYGLLSPYSRLHESEADRIGVDYLHAAGYDARAAISLWEKMGASGGQRPPEILSTHPDPTTRMANLRAYIAQKGY